MKLLAIEPTNESLLYGLSIDTETGIVETDDLLIIFTGLAESSLQYLLYQ